MDVAGLTLGSAQFRPKFRIEQRQFAPLSADLEEEWQTVFPDHQPSRPDQGGHRYPANLYQCYGTKTGVMAYAKLHNESQGFWLHPD